METDTRKVLSYRQKLRNQNNWIESSANEFGQLANGFGGRIKNPTNTIAFIGRRGIPHNRLKDVTYGQLICIVLPKKKETNRTRFTVGRYRIDYPGEVTTSIADVLLAKILFNSIISTKGARFITIDISNFYLMTPLKRPEYIRIHIRDIPYEIIKDTK